MKLSTDIETGKGRSIDGTAGDDHLTSGNGRQILSGLGGNDILEAGAGGDTLFGDSSSMTGLEAGGDDMLIGGSGSDTLYGDGISDSGGGLRGGNDTLLGGDGDDVIYGDGIAAGSDYSLSGGDDIITGGAGDDILWGDGQGFLVDGDMDSHTNLIPGSDVFVFGTSDGNDVIMDFNPDFGWEGYVTDLIDLSSTSLAWSDLDTNGDNILDQMDAVASLNSDGQLVIDLGLAAGGDAGMNTITFVPNEYYEIQSLSETDFMFA